MEEFQAKSELRGALPWELQEPCSRQLRCLLAMVDVGFPGVGMNDCHSFCGHLLIPWCDREVPVGDRGARALDPFG